MNAFGRGRALDSVRAADVLLPAGEHVRFHDDGRLDVPRRAAHRKTLAPAESAAWFAARGYEPIALADLAGSEGVFGLAAPAHGRGRAAARRSRAFLLSFATRGRRARRRGVDRPRAGAARPAPANVKLLSGSHLHHTRRVWQDEDARDVARAAGRAVGGRRAAVDAHRRARASSGAACAHRLATHAGGVPVRRLLRSRRGARVRGRARRLPGRAARARRGERAVRRRALQAAADEAPRARAARRRDPDAGAPRCRASCRAPRRSRATPATSSTPRSTTSPTARRS